jgi:hypothetical protein
MAGHGVENEYSEIREVKRRDQKCDDFDDLSHVTVRDFEFFTTPPSRWVYR